LGQRLGFKNVRRLQRRRRAQGGRRAGAFALGLALAAPLACQTQTTVSVAPSTPAATTETSPSVFEPQANQIAAIPGTQVQRESDRLVIFLSGDELFESGTATLAPAAPPRLHDFAQAVRSAPDARVAVRGYTDAQGSESFNLTLSEDRADMVRKFLVGEGIEPGHISAAGFGPQFPVAPNDTPEGRRMNRRIEIELRPAASAGLQGGAPEPR
jgi:outer membrane protein OmpA-like peptidoglycan-associated protein